MTIIRRVVCIRNVWRLIIEYCINKESCDPVNDNYSLRHLYKKYMGIRHYIELY